MTGTHPSVERRVRARRVGPGRVVRLLAAGSALSMLSLSVAVTGAGAASDVASIGTALCDGATVALTGDVTESSAVLTVAGGCTATLDLNGSKLTVERVVLEAGSTLTIADTSPEADGMVVARSSANQAAFRTTGATLLVESGSIDALAGSNAAGIGGDLNGGAGTVHISGGTVEAMGGFGSAGIGGGRFGDGGTVEITGGSVTAKGGNGGAGIGGGAIASNGTGGGGGTVIITGGTVQATSINDAVQPIGPGLDGSGIDLFVADGATQETETNFNVTTLTIAFPPPPALSLVTQPSGAVVGAPLGVQPVVGLVDAAGVAVVQSGVEVSVAVASGPGSLDGVTSVETGSDGLAVFSGLSIDAEGEHTLVFTADGLEPVTSGTVLVGGGAVSDHPGVTVQVDASPLLVSVADAVVAFTVTAGTVLDGGPNGVDGAARRETAVTFDNPVGSASGSARVEVEFAAVPEALSATSAGSVPDRELVLHLWVEPPATAAFDTEPVSWGAAADGAQVLVSGIGQGVGLQSGLTMWWGLSGQTGAGTGGVPVTVGTVTFTITDDDG